MTDYGWIYETEQEKSLPLEHQVDMQEYCLRQLLKPLRQCKYLRLVEVDAPPGWKEMVIDASQLNNW